MPIDEEIYGAAPEPLDYNKAWGEYKNGEKPLLDALMSNYTKPVQQITAEQAKKAKFGSAMTDTFTSIAEMFAHGQGARVRNRDGKSNVQTTNEKLKALDDEYEAKMQNYGGVRANAELQDFNRKMETDRYNAGAKRNYYLNIQAQKAKAAALKYQMDKDAATLQRQLDKDKSDAGLKQQGISLQGDALDETKRNNKASNEIGMINALRERKGAAGVKDGQTIPIFHNQKQYSFPVSYINTVLDRAIKDGMAGDIPDKSGRGSSKVTSTTALSKEQKMQIFQNVYQHYVVPTEDGRFTISQKRRTSTPQGTGKTAKPAQQQQQSNNDPLGIL